MTRDEAKKLLPVIQAFVDGKEIEWKRDDGTWGMLVEPAFGASPDRYRIKPETLECWVVIDCEGDIFVEKLKHEAELLRKMLYCQPTTIHHMREVIE